MLLVWYLGNKSVERGALNAALQVENRKSVQPGSHVFLLLRKKNKFETVNWLGSVKNKLVNEKKFSHRPEGQRN